MSIAAAIDWAERELVKAEGLKEAVAVMQTLRSAEGVAQSLESRAHDAKMDLEKAEAAKAAVLAQIEENKAQAQAWAEKLTVAAQEQAKATEAKASETAAQMLAAADKKRQTSEAKAKDAEKRADLAEEALRLAQQEHAALTKQMEAMREIAKALG